jgi:hypothetical protein
MASEFTDSDGVQFIGTANVDVTTLNLHDASEYRRELIHALREPGMEFDMVGKMSEADRKFYKKKLEEVDAYLKTFSEGI